MSAVSARVVVATDFGGPEVLSVIDQQVPDPGAGEVRIAVRAAGVNPIDVKVYSGAFGTDRSQLPRRLGSEASGVVTAVGEGVDGIAVGEEVIAFRAPGACASELVAPAEAIVAKPPALGWHEAAGLLLTGGTAVHTLTATGVRDGDIVLVHGGSGGVGLQGAGAPSTARRCPLKGAALPPQRRVGAPSPARTCLLNGA